MGLPCVRGVSSGVPCLCLLEAGCPLPPLLSRPNPSPTWPKRDLRPLGQPPKVSALPPPSPRPGTPWPQPACPVGPRGRGSLVVRTWGQNRRCCVGVGAGGRGTGRQGPVAWGVSAAGGRHPILPLGAPERGRPHLPCPLDPGLPRAPPGRPCRWVGGAPLGVRPVLWGAPVFSDNAGGKRPDLPRLPHAERASVGQCAPGLSDQSPRLVSPHGASRPGSRKGVGRGSRRRRERLPLGPQGQPGVLWIRVSGTV